MLEADTSPVGFGHSGVFRKAYIARNLIQDNGWEGRQYADAGIAAVRSKNVLIEDNVFGGHAFGNGIKIIQDDRLTGDTHGWIVWNIVIGSNQMNGEEVQGCHLGGSHVGGVTCSWRSTRPGGSGHRISVSRRRF